MLLPQAPPPKFGRRLGKPEGEVRRFGKVFDTSVKVGDTETFKVVSKLLSQVRALL